MNELKDEHAEIVAQYKLQSKSSLSYMLTIARDGESPVRSIYYFNNALDAVHAYNRYQDHGFSKEYLTVTLYEPNGQIQEKILKRPPAGECSFVRQNYIDCAKLLLSIKTDIDLETYEKIVNGLALIFSQDNPRFDENRFFNQTQINQIGK